MVRLRDNGNDALNLGAIFQFQNGTIKRALISGFCGLVTVFQFQNGTIKRKEH